MSASATAPSVGATLPSEQLLIDNDATAAFIGHDLDVAANADCATARRRRPTLARRGREMFRPVADSYKGVRMLWHGGSIMFLTSSGPDTASPVLLLHGGGVAGWMWDSLRERLEPNYAVLVPDLPGHGRSATEPYVSHTTTIAAIAELLATTVPGRPATVIGFSLGAQLAIQLASEHPDLVSQAVIVSAQAKAMPFTDLTLAAIGVSASLARKRWFAKLQARELFIPPHQMENYISTSAGITKATLLAAVGGNVTFTLPNTWSTFSGRVLIMVGGRERRLMRDSADSIHAALPASELSVVDGCGHGIPLQRPDWFNDRVVDWLAAA